MSVRITWPPSNDPIVASYNLERGLSVGGPWFLLVNVLHDLAGANWSPTKSEFFYIDLTGTDTSFYRLTVIDADGQHSLASSPFQSPGTTSSPPSLTNTLDVVVGDVGILLNLGFTTIEIWVSDNDGGSWIELTASNRITLVDGAVIYTYYDISGTPNRRYKWRFSANGLAPISLYSQYAAGKPLPLAGVSLSVATASFVGPDGRPQQRNVIIVVDAAQAVPGFAVGNATQTIVVQSNEEGFWQTPLIQGIKVRVAIEGTGIVRSFTVPNTPTFDLMQAISDAPDPFTVQTTPPLLTRRHI